MRALLTAVWLLLALGLNAQNQKMNWYFGRSAAMTFEDGFPKALSTNPLTRYNRASATANHPRTGELLFYTNGYEVRNASHTKIKDIDGGGTNLDVMVLPIPGQENYWYLFTLNSAGGPTSQQTLSFYAVYVAEDGTSMAVSVRKEISTGYHQFLTAVRNCKNDGFWLLSYNWQENTMLAFDVHETGVETEPVTSDVNFPIQVVGDLVTNSAGNMLAISSFYADAGTAQVVVLDINKQCGTLSFQKALHYPGGENAFGLAFSPNSEYLFVTYSVGASELVEFNIKTGAYFLVAISDYNFNELQTGPDGKIYITTHTIGVPGNRIDAINFPDLWGQPCDYAYGVVDLGPNRSGNFHFPNFLQDYTTDVCPFDDPDIDIESTCLGEPLEVKHSPLFERPDSFYWRFNDSLYERYEPTLEVDESGTYLLQFYWAMCNRLDSITDTLVISPRHEFSLGADTSICVNDTLQIGHGTGVEAYYEWSNSLIKDSFIKVTDTGTYCLNININGCLSSSCIKIDFEEEIWTTLKNEYFLCPHANDLVRLNAGKGFDKYLWYPTGDSTQWIEVKDLGDYFVMVDDFRGCSATDSTRVKRRCPPSVFFPNAFSPDANGLNDSFGGIGEDIVEYHLEVYNRWGECVFNSNELSLQWDGTFKGEVAPNDQYFWICEYAGYNERGHITRQWTNGRVVLMK